MAENADAEYRAIWNKVDELTRTNGQSTPLTLHETARVITGDKTEKLHCVDEPDVNKWCSACLSWTHYVCDGFNSGDGGAAWCK